MGNERAKEHPLLRVVSDRNIVKKDRDVVLGGKRWTQDAATGIHPNPWDAAVGGVDFKVWGGTADRYFDLPAWSNHYTRIERSILHRSYQFFSVYQQHIVFPVILYKQFRNSSSILEFRNPEAFLLGKVRKGFITEFRARP